MFLGVSAQQLTLFILSQIVTGGVLFVFTALNEGRRQRLTANFERKQQHYSELFEVIYKVTKGLSLENENVFTSPGTFDITKIEVDLASKDMLRIDALSQIWATTKVRDAVGKWATHRSRFLLTISTVKIVHGLPVAKGEFATKKREAQHDVDGMEKAMESLVESIQDDLLISRNSLWKLFARP